MINYQQKGRKQSGADKSEHNDASTPKKKSHTADGSDMTYNPELDKFSGDGSVPDKYKEDGKRLANSTLPSFK